MVASNVWNQVGWEEIPNGSVLVVDRVGQEAELEKILTKLTIQVLNT